MTPELQEKLAELLAGNREPDLTAFLDELQPYDIAGLLPDLSHPEQRRLLAVLPPDVAAETLEHLGFEDQYHLLDHLEEDAARSILAVMASDALVDLAGAVHPRQAEQLLKWVPPEAVARIRSLMAYPENTAGGRMTVNYIAVRQGWTAAQVIAHIRKVGHAAELLNYIYVVDGAGRLTGVTSLRDVLLAAPETPVAAFQYTKVVTVAADADQEQAARVIAQYDFVALPVVDSGGRLVGMLTIDDVLDVLEEEATEDIHKLGGTTPLEEPYLKASFMSLYRKRIVWLLVLFVLQSVTLNILSHFESYVAAVTALAVFIPLVIGTGGNSGAQASTLVIRAMALGEVTFHDFLRVVWRESRLGLTLGLTMAAATLVRGYFVGGGLAIGLTASVTIALIVVVGSVAGAGLPLIGRRLGFDPAVFASPLITTIADATGLVIYFQTARIILGL